MRRSLYLLFLPFLALFFEPTLSIESLIHLIQLCCVSFTFFDCVLGDLSLCTMVAANDGDNKVATSSFPRT
jgi:hypothetical protein